MSSTMDMCVDTKDTTKDFRLMIVRFLHPPLFGGRIVRFLHPAVLWRGRLMSIA